MNYYIILKFYVVFKLAVFVQCVGKEERIVERAIPGNVKGPPRTSAQFRAVWTTCHEEVMYKHPTEVSEARRKELLRFPGNDNDERIIRPLIRRCKRKIVISIRLNNEGRLIPKEEVIIVDHVTDALSQRRSRLHSPYVLKLKQEQPSQMFGLNFIQLVNAEPTEEVINKNNPNYEGCDVNPRSKKPTCGLAFIGEKAIPFSQGFCCACKAEPSTTPKPCQNESKTKTSMLVNEEDERKQRKPHTRTKKPETIPIKSSRTRRKNKGRNAEEKFTECRLPVDKKKSRAKREIAIDDSDISTNENENHSGFEGKNFRQSLPNERKTLASVNNSNEVKISNSKSENPAYLNNKSVNENSFDENGQQIEIVQKRHTCSCLEKDKKDTEKTPLPITIPMPIFIRRKRDVRKYDEFVDDDFINEDETRAMLQDDQNFINNYKRREAISRLIRSYGGKITDEINFLSQKRKRQLPKNFIQIRGEQNCVDKTVPPSANPETYHHSTHCLRFSDLWYSVWSFDRPFAEHTIYLQLYQKLQDIQEGTSKWRDLTGGSQIRIGKLKTQAWNRNGTVAFRYSSYEGDYEAMTKLNYKTMRLVVPEPVPDRKAELYPQSRGDPSEFLVVATDSFAKNAEECNKIGIGYKGFVNQRNRCDVPKGSCLENQLLEMWREDMKTKVTGEKGQYFLENFGTISKWPIRTNLQNNKQYLGFDFYGNFSTTVEIEINADNNDIYDKGASARITEVYVDGSWDTSSRITVIVTNIGLISTTFSVRVRDFPSHIPTEWVGLQTAAMMILPYHNKKFNLKLDGTIPEDKIYCSVELMNSFDQVISTRRILLRRSDRCFCIWHCLCACMSGANGLKCESMSPEHYNAAGFQGQVTVSNCCLTDLLLNLLLILAIFYLLLILLGITKGILGLCCCPPVGAWGLDVLVNHAKKIPYYYEEELYGRTVIYDCAGFPVHPDTKLRTVRCISRCTEFYLNVIFFVVYPFALCCSRIRRLNAKSCHCSCGGKKSDCGDERPLCACEGEEENTPLLPCPNLPRGKKACDGGRKEYEQCEGSNCEGDEAGREYQQCWENENDNVMLYDRDGERDPYSEPLTYKESRTSGTTMDYIDRMLNTQVVFRILRAPIGGVNIPSGVTYCIRGFFIEAQGCLKFITASPLHQFWTFLNDDFVRLDNPRILDPDDFELDFYSEEEVFDNHELSLTPNGTCINIDVQNF